MRTREEATTMTADTWLYRYLTEHGETPAPTVKRDAAEAGHNTRTLQRAIKRIGGQVVGQGKATRWSLPATETATGNDTAKAADRLYGPPCPSCGYCVGANMAGPPPHRWCSHCGNRWTP